MKLSRYIFLIFFSLYLLFPSDRGLREVGFGPEGFRILILDIFVILLILINFDKLYIGAKWIKNFVGAVAIILFLGSTFISFVRGFPLYGGWAIGESRWFFSIILMPIGFIIYRKSITNSVKSIFFVFAVYHSLIIIYSYITGKAWDTAGDVMRFAGGRESLIIAISCIYLIIDLVNDKGRYNFVNFLELFSLIYFIFILIIGQTRSIFLFLPVGLLLFSLVFSNLTLKTLMKYVIFTFVFILVLVFVIVYLIPEQIQASILASFSVIGEVFNPATYQFLFNPITFTSSEARNLFSTSGNTYFRVLAWSQVLANINDYPYGWFIGMPMGTGFEWIGPSGELLENMQPHNDYIAILSKVGFMGLIGYWLIVWAYLRLAFKTTRNYSRTEILRSDIPIIFITIVMILFFVSLNAEIRTYGSHFWVWIFLGFGFRSLDKLNGNKFSMNKLFSR